jgi:hypothetical protein
MSSVELETQLRSSYRWISEFAEQKATKFPRLEKVTLMEDVGNSRVSWAYPETLLKAFEATGIRLVVEIAIEW